MGSFAPKATVTLENPACNSAFAHACIRSIFSSAVSMGCATVSGVDASVAGVGGSFPTGVTSFADFPLLPPRVGGVTGVGADSSAPTPPGFVSCVDGCTVVGVIGIVGAGVSTPHGDVLLGASARPSVSSAGGLDAGSISLNVGAVTFVAMNVGKGVVSKPPPPVVGRSFARMARSTATSHKGGDSS
ncbi:hypothetical protein SUGI_0417960 [Cryptomeria japonica]|uniref:uncharacterized protein LOC131036122 isoform X2 n=1 Tax=Cryptomeria japonica TaxID=3369 RepID=UPI002408A92B|nr:uncharacterized protein LOC131036122 isoform X2 [Cryptomeria japonica]GLJ22234.1 hypothetical protein SUGI_0417960 [Cryptomeria japonica]